jgi:inner membrane transporter RhtA
VVACAAVLRCGPCEDAAGRPALAGADSYTRQVNRPALPPVSLVAAGAVSVQFGAAFATHLFSRVGPVGAVTLRLVIAAIILAALPRATKSSLPSTKADWSVAVAFGLVLAGMNLSFYEAIARIPLGPAVTVEFSGPLLVALVGSRRWSDGLWAAMAGTGVALLASGTGRELDPGGVALAGMAGAFWVAYIVLNKQTGQRFEARRGLTIAMVTGAAVVLPAGLVSGAGSLFSWYVLGLGSAVALLSSVVPYWLELLALRRVTRRAFGVMLSLDPALAALAGLVVLGQHPGARELAAMALVIAANVGNSVAGRPTVAVQP